jgi:hypothetical protein
MPMKKKRSPLPAGAKGHATHKGKQHTLLVINTDGRVLYKVGRDTYPSPSGAARAITGYKVNGWRFWHLE